MGYPDRTILMAAKLQFKAGDVKAAKNTIQDLLKHGKREQVKLGAARFVLEHQRELMEHQQGSKVTLQGVPATLQVQIVPVTPQQPTPQDNDNSKKWRYWNGVTGEPQDNNLPIQGTPDAV